jgi:hypothetical protein
MKRLLRFCLLVGLSAISTTGIFSQTIKISAEVRPRFEYRHGYKTLFPDDFNPASFVSQRTRLNGYFENPVFKAFVSFQNVRVWGDVNQLNKGDAYGVAVHEAWGEIFLTKTVSLKIGRQEIIYDDHRIFGNVGWAQQARSHDAAIVVLKPGSNHKIDIGFAYNAMKESLYKDPYTNLNYKALQVVHYHGQFGKSGLSILFLNNGLPYDADADTTKYDEKISYSQTIGGRYTLNGDKIKLHAATYYQGGKNKSHNSLSAYYFAGDISFLLVKSFSFGFGFEYLSGTASRDKGVSGQKDRSFSPFYGTNHKFNGLMDYFYVGNHAGNVGLVDFYLPLKVKIKKLSLAFTPHYFSAATTLSTKDTGTGAWTDYSNGLGTELDFVVSYPVIKSVVIAGGYSQLFATSSMQALKYPDNPAGEFNNNANNWGWVMVTFKPTLYSKEKSKQ